MDVVTKTHDDMGFEFLSEPVSKQSGSNASDRRVYRDDAQILRVTDTAKFAAEFGDACVLAIMNGTSIRVMSQAKNRSLPRNAPHADVQQAIVNQLRGLRNAPTATIRIVEKIVTVTKHALPDGSTYDGTDVTEFQAAYAAALSDVGIPSAQALEIARLQTL